MTSETWLKKLEERKRNEQQPQTEPTQITEQPPEDKAEDKKLTDRAIIGKVRRMLDIVDLFEEKNDSDLLEIYQLWLAESLIGRPFIVEKPVTPPLKTPEHILLRKRLQTIQNRHLREIEDYKEKCNEKIKQSLQRKIAYCFACRKSVPCENPTYRIKESKTRKPRIQILSKCPSCSQLLVSKGGYLPERDKPNRYSMENEGING